MKKGIVQYHRFNLVLWSAIVISLLGCGGGSGSGGGSNPPARTLDVALVDIMKQKCDEQTLQLLVAVLDHTGMPLRGLPAQAFSVVENSRPKTITDLSQLATTPMSLSLVLDYSDSLSNPDQEAIKEAAKDFLLFMQAEDEAQCVKFGDTIQSYPAVGFSTRKDELVAFIDEPFSYTGGTRLYRAIAQAIEQQVSESQNGIRAIILFSDGQDEEWPQEFTLNSVIELAQQAAVPIYSLYYQGNQNADKRFDMRRLAEETGGRYYEAAVSDDFLGILQDIDDALANRYILEYITSAGANDPIVVEVEAEHNGIRGEDSRQATGC
jgi:VWFA-related protein